MYKVLPEAFELFYSGSYIHLLVKFWVYCTPRVSFKGGGGVNRYGEKEKVVFPAHPCLTNSRGDSSIQGIINISSN